MSKPLENPPTVSEPRLADLTRLAVLALKTRRWTLATAESCTGGWLAKQMTDLPGSSEVFDCGFICYSNSAKIRVLGVPAATLEAYGAVSPESAAAMVAGALERSSADIAVSVTGIAGPSGGSADKPVGTVWLGIGVRGAEPLVERHLFHGDRNAVRAQSVAVALAVVERILKPA